MTDDDITRADLTRELHYMQTQVEQHGYPGTRAVLAELERLSKENARLWAIIAAANDALVRGKSSEARRALRDAINVR